ncbi:hypothetical protein AMAG_04087 [Allomyces macrogynus ATCC 38327]|uniref:GOLD domain-containing protein n=1 Tax=Allomyces macrogynus (strain ATCC 38327) TaxID=578462 RepID=A0A0L0S7Y1_ALLM3|nr:hypothetical protein AMAG_04087 [Allomyces macrogynus ATCC 38327]|eukprot:KNE58520.1 hypothetical protein AMAG_04087 [Allomyces macrogynus ATCC 38327]
MSILARAVLRPHLIAAVTLALALLATVVSAFTVRVAPHASTCFYEDLRIDQKTLVTFQVGEGGSLDVDFWVSDPNDAMLQLDHRVSQGTYQLIPSIAGKYTYCFSNQMSSISEKLVQFSVHGADVPPVDPKGTLCAPIVDPVMEIVNELARDIHSIKEEQQYIVTRERAHRNTAESTNARVMWWSLLQTAMLVAVCLFQIYYLKHFFEVRRVI